MTLLILVEWSRITTRKAFSSSAERVGDVLDARRTLLDAQMTEARALAEHHAFLAELSLHCGVDVINDFTSGARPVTPTKEKP